MQKIKLTFIIVVAMACGWYLRGFVDTITSRSTTLKNAKEQQITSAPTNTNITQFQISSTRVQQNLSDLNKLYTQIRIVPYYQNELPAGMKILSLEHPSFFEELGFAQGDIVETINGEILSLQNAMYIFDKLKTSTQFDIQISRRGKKETFHYTITE